MDEAWTRVLPDMVDAYLEWRHSPSQAGETSSPDPGDSPHRVGRGVRSVIRTGDRQRMPSVQRITVIR